MLFVVVGVIDSSVFVGLRRRLRWSARVWIILIKSVHMLARIIILVFLDKVIVVSWLVYSSLTSQMIITIHVLKTSCGVMLLQSVYFIMKINYLLICTLWKWIFMCILVKSLFYFLLLLDYLFRVYFSCLFVNSTSCCFVSFLLLRLMT